MRSGSRGEAQQPRRVNGGGNPGEARLSRSGRARPEPHPGLFLLTYMVQGGVRCVVVLMWGGSGREWAELLRPHCPPPSAPVPARLG